MHRNCLKIASLVIISGCATWSKPDTKSDWGALTSAASLDCTELPLLPEDLRIDKVRVLDSSGPSLLLEVTSRKGVRNFYHLAFRKTGDLTPQNLVKLPVSTDSTFLGGGVSGSKTVFVIHTFVKDKPVFQIRDLSNNALISQIPTKLKAFELGSWQLTADRLVALIREDKNDEATDDQPYQQIEIPIHTEKGSAQVVSRVIGNQVVSFTDAQQKRHILSLDRGLSSSKKDPRFKITPWMAGKKDGISEVDEKGPIESWNFSESEKGLTLAYVKGDSLLWENTSLEVTSLSVNEPFSKQTQAKASLSRVHVAQPLIASNSQETLVFLPQWLDHEISVAGYRFNGSELAPIGYLGVFKEGSAFERAFYHQPSEKFYLLSRFNSAAVARYSLCEVEK
ncbi:MAG: hypothetical protein EOP07_01230 [Proteobacteria bacterium]|nr:MAG: hypothetical protein EOP07_01230 [Pseudomonadota bacterium]